ncbi:MAG: tetratricopeptide repeat protein [bacterium]
MNETIICPYCEAINPKDSRYCRKCGARIPTASQKEIARILLSASLHLANKRYEEAERDCRLAIENDPFNADAHSLLGDILERRGDIPSAIEEYKEAIRLAPQESFYRTRLDEIAKKKPYRASSLRRYIIWLISLSFLIFLAYRLFSLLLSQGKP